MPFVDGNPISKYNGTQGFYDAWNSIHKGRTPTEADIGVINSYGDQFSTLFRNYVGRDANSVEQDQFFKGVVVPQGAFADPQKLRDRTASFIGDTFQEAAKDQSGIELQKQQGQANTLADLFRKQSSDTLNQYSQGLQDFSAKLMERVRPQLITSLQAQGLLNTGGLNEAIAGQQADFVNQASQQVNDLRLQQNQQADAISFGGASSQYEFDKANTLNRLPLLQQMGNTGLTNAYNTQAQSNLFAQQMNYLNRQGQLQQRQKTGFGSVFGNSLAQSLGTSLGKVSASSGTESTDASGGVASTAAMFALGSAREIKKNISRLSEKEEDALYDRFVKMPMNRWHYKTESDSIPRHLGVMTDEALPEFVNEGGMSLSPVDYFGAVTVAIKVLNRRLLRQGK